MNKRQVAWEAAYAKSTCAWDTRIPAPELILRLAELRLGPSRVLDIGCGTGANAIFMASQGHTVTGVDFVSRAVKEAARAAEAAEVDVEFRQVDFLELTEFDQTFDFVLDSGCYHFTRKVNLQTYMDVLFRVMKPQSICLSLIGNPEDGEHWGPARVAAMEVLSEHHPFFELLDLRRFVFDSAVPNFSPLGWSTLLRRRTQRLCLGQAMQQSLHNGRQELRGTDSTRPNLAQRLQGVLSEISIQDTFLRGLSIQMSENPSSPENGDLLIEYTAPDRDSAEPRTVRYRRPSAVDEHLTDEQFLHVILTNLAVIAVHEMMEGFRLRGQRAFDPHELARFLDSRYAELITMTRSGVRSGK